MDIDEPKGLIDGFEEDFLRISREFSVSHTRMQLTDFFIYWIENKLDLIFVNRYDPRELLEAISEMNKLLVTKLDGHKDNPDWIVALYMLLCIYLKQPQRQRRCIRVTIDEFIRVEKLLVTEGDPKFAWKCLKNSNAIHLAEEKALYGPHLLKKGGNKSYDSAHQQSKQIEILREDTRSMIDKQEKLIQEFETMYSPYTQILKSLDIEAKTTQLAEMKETIKKLKQLIEE